MKSSSRALGLAALFVLVASVASAGDYTRSVDSVLVEETAPTTTTFEPVEEPTVTVETDVSYAVETLAYSASSGNFYFWLDGYSVASGDTQCGNGTKFGVDVSAQNDELIAQVKMAFLSGRKVKVYWDSGACVGGAPAPHYIKIYR